MRECNEYEITVLRNEVTPLSGINCCLNCAERHYKCHSTCIKYIEAKEELEAFKQKQLEDRNDSNERIRSLWSLRPCRRKYH